MNRMRLAYLVSRYPAISHTFILREVLGLRNLGIDVEIASINGLDRAPGALTAEETAEASRTFYIKQAGAGGVLQALLPALVQRPGAWFSALWFAIRLGGTDLKRIEYDMWPRKLCGVQFVSH